MEPVRLSVTLIALNEADRIQKTLESVRWADEVLLVDSGSTDETVQLARDWGAKVIEQRWLGFGKQKNLAQTHAQFDWVLNIDADEVVTPELATEIQSWLQQQEVQRLEGKTPGLLAIPRKNFYRDQWIRFGGWYPNYVVRLGHRSSSSWTEPHLHEMLRGSGTISYAKNPLLHFTFRSISDQVRTNLRYALEGSRELQKRNQSFSVLKLIVKPWLKFIETYFWKFGFLDGRFGFIISVNAAHSMFLKQAFLLEKKDSK